MNDKQMQLSSGISLFSQQEFENNAMCPAYCDIVGQ